ncbi:MAG: GNAT family N-acetyltransferase [Rhizobiaceae bacterium]|nr:GNAT family N-acetyltransferase [Rhizobiaceae bacterium]
MTNDITLITKKPSECSVSELNKFVALVESGDEVIDGLICRVKTRGERLVFLYQSGVLAGTAAIKQPYEDYRSRVFNKAKTSLQPEDFSLELGWIVVSSEFRRKGYAGMLIKESMMVIGGKKTFATTRKDNEAIHHYLKSHKFSLCGEPYRSENREEHIVLFVRQ